LFDSLQLPELPSLNDKVTGTFASFTIVAHEVRKIKNIIEVKVLNILNAKLFFVFNQHKLK
tara:strand:+ start:69 stop:251 length:183 start_codon:yes stop_codon:yes gene_type:complete